jgi:hypothetical protein
LAIVEIADSLRSIPAARGAISLTFVIRSATYHFVSP